MRESVTLRFDASDEGFSVAVKLIANQNNDIKFEVKPWPIHVPAAAVIHEWRALSVIIGRIGCVGCKGSYKLL